MGKGNLILNCDKNLMHHQMTLIPRRDVKCHLFYTTFTRYSSPNLNPRSW